MRIVDCVQGSPEWFAARLGKVTASRLSDVMAKGKGISRAKYAAELISERLTGERAEGFKSASTEWGNETEAAARTHYEFMTDCTVQTVGLVLHPMIDQSGASPDGLVGDVGAVQFKCPETHTHIAYMLGGPVPGSYVLQMQWEMACAKRMWCDFVSFDPRLPADMRMHRRRFTRDGATIVECETEVRAFLAEIDATIAKLTALANREAAE